MRQQLIATLFAGVSILGVAGCGSDDDASGNSTTTSQVTGTTAVEASSTTAAVGSQVMTGTAQVPIENFRYTPETLTVKAGTTVTWTNNDSMMHTVTSGANREADGKFDRNLQRGESYSFTFDAPGTYEYYCKPHENMVASVTVVA